jgi:hypothetical protein
MRYIGVNDSFLQLLKDVSEAFVPHAYAQASASATTATTCGSKLLPNTLGVCSIYDFILNIVNAFMKFFLYPAMIGMWVWSGFSYVAAQGAPEKLSKAHKLLLMAFVTTIITFMIQGFLTAIKGSVDKILPAPSAVTGKDPASGTPDGRVAPKDGAIGSPCTLDDGVTTGIYGGDASSPTCFPSGRGQTSTSFVDCSTLTSQSACQAAKSKASGNSCSWSGGRDAVCSDGD